ncbi:MAG: hypothetical protein IMZ66_11565 [Planctomycetes bacterium]|nr:hypothetical protein [Planctomycetota bacterium]
MRFATIVLAGLLGAPAVAGAAEAPSVAVPLAEILKDEARLQHEQLSKDVKRLDWFRRVGPQAFNAEALVTEKDRDPADIVLRRTRALLADIERAAPAGRLTPLAEALAALEARAGQVAVADGPARRALYDEACALRRKIALANPRLDFTSILFAKHHRARADHMCDQYFGFTARPGGGIFVLEDAFGPAPRVRDLLAGAAVESGRLQGRALEGGSFLQPQLSFDAAQVLFSYTECAAQGEPWSPGKSYHVFRVNADGSHLVQLTDGAWNDLHPNWLADGRVMFMSERRGGFGRCHPRQVPIYTLHAMDAAGADLVRLSHHESNEWHPSLDNDGMIVYSRWDYVDRGHNQAHHAWITTPDGRDARAVHGNFKKQHDDNPDMELSVRAIPGSRRYVATAAPHHGQAYGSFIIIDPRVQDDDAMAPLRRLTPETGFVETGENGPQAYGTAWPLSETYYLCVYDRGGGRYGLYLLDAFGNRELLYADPQIACLGPVPLKARPVPPLITPVGEPARLVANPTYRQVGDEHPLDLASAGMRGTGIVGVVNVYNSLYPYPEGAKVTALRIVQVLPKSTALHHEPQVGYGCETSARAVLGTVPVEADGSAYFQLPPGKEVYFQALDERGLAVQSMRSATYVHAGERLVCSGCHDRRERSPGPGERTLGLAFRRAPSTITPEVEGASPLSYPRLVQPVLEKHCVACHAKEAGKPKVMDLAAGDWQKDPYHWYASYRNLYPYAFHFGAKFNPGFDGFTSARTVPGKFGAKASKLLALLDKGHYDVKLSPGELRRITLWLDANSDFFGAYEDTGAQARGEVVQPKLE